MYPEKLKSSTNQSGVSEAGKLKFCAPFNESSIWLYNLIKINLEKPGFEFESSTTVYTREDYKENKKCVHWILRLSERD